MGPPWTSMTTGWGPSPSGVATKPWMRWPSGLVNDHDRKGRPAGARSPGGASTSSPARVRTVAGAAPLASRNQTSPSGRTPAPEMVPSGWSIASSAPESRYRRWSRLRPSCSWIEQQGAGVGPPVLDLHVAGQVEGVVPAPAGGQVPDGRALQAVALLAQGQPLVAGHRRPAGDAEAEARPVPLVAPAGAGAGVDHPDGQVHGVAVLGVGQGQQAGVTRQAGHVDRLGVVVDQAGGGVALGDVDGVAVVGGGAGDDQAVAEAEPGRSRRRRRPGARDRGSPPSKGATSQWPTSSPVTSWNHTTPAPSGVAAPPSTPIGSSVTWRRSAGRPVPGVDLPRPALVRRVARGGQARAGPSAGSRPRRPGTAAPRARSLG